jgi:hypothetical protein
VTFLIISPCSTLCLESEPHRATAPASSIDEAPAPVPRHWFKLMCFFCTGTCAYVSFELLIPSVLCLCNLKMLSEKYSKRSTSEDNINFPIVRKESVLVSEG